MPHPYASPRKCRGNPFPIAALAHEAELDATGPVPMSGLPPDARRAVRGQLDDSCPVPEWTEEDIVQLHWRLLLELRRLPDPETPLEEKLDTLAWALTEPELDDQPFSFATCLRVVGTSPLSPTAYFGALSVDGIRDWLRANARRWLDATLARYPDWAQALVRQQPQWVARQLERNSQWLNEEIKRRGAATQRDLFSDGLAPPQ